LSLLHARLPSSAFLYSALSSRPALSCFFRVFYGFFPFPYYSVAMARSFLLLLLFFTYLHLLSNLFPQCFTPRIIQVYVLIFHINRKIPC